MSKAVKYMLIGLAGLLLIVAGGAAFIATTFDPNDYKPQIIALVKEQKQRTLTIPGEIKLSLFPKISAELGRFTLSEHQASAEFATVESAKVSLALLPLLARQLVIDRVEIKGLSVRLRREQGGATNYDDLLSAQESSARPIRFDIDGVTIVNGRIALDDQMAQRKVELAGLDLQTGRIANAVPSNARLSTRINSSNPVLDASLELKTKFSFDLDRKRYAIDLLDGELKGAAFDFTELLVKVAGEGDLRPEARHFEFAGLKLSATGKQGGKPVELRLEAPKLAIVGDELSGSKISGEARLSPGGKHGATTIAGTVSTGIMANLRSGQVDLPGIAVNVTLPDPAGGAMTLVANGSAQADMHRQSVSADVKGKLDESSFDARLGLAGFSPAAYTFDINVDRLDADRYRAGTGKEKPMPAGRPDKPIDLSALRELQASGSLHVASLKAGNIRLSNLRLSLKASGGRIDINPLSAGLYGGTMAGSAGLVAAAQPKFLVRQSLSGINVGALLQDALGRDPVEGRGNVMLDVSTEGGLSAQWKKNLNGTARIELRDGAVKGFNIGQAIRTARSRVGELRGDAPAQSGTGNAAERSDFSEMSGSFTITRGLARNQDLRAKSPLLRVDGSGNIDLGVDRLDYLLKATIVPTLQGQGGPELQALKGLTVPVRLSGPFTAIGYQVDFSGIAADLVNKQLDRRKDEIKGKVEEQLRDKLKGLFGR